MFLAPCWLGWSMVRAGRASRRTALEPGRGGGGRRGNVVHSSVSVLRSGALFQTYTAHNTSHRHRHQPLLYTLWVVCEVTSSDRRSGDCANKPVNSDPCVRHSGETDNLTSCVSVVIVLYMTPTVTCPQTLVAPEGVVTYRCGAAVGEDWAKAVEKRRQF